VGVLFYPTAARAGPMGGRRGTARRPRGGMGQSARRPPAACATAHDREGVVPHGPCSGNVALASDNLRVSCVRPDGGKTLRALGYELPHPAG
jgi:hypothetical protein